MVNKLDDADQRWHRVQVALGSLITGRARADGTNWENAYENMLTYMKRLELEPQLDKMKVLHVAGTKGKGSTCSFASSVLTQCGYRVGLFTSPHLCDVRERIRINGALVSRDDFEEAFWYCYNTLERTATPEVAMPAYFRFLFLLSLKIFAAQDLDVVVFEVGLGGRLDATNVFPAPVATCVTLLDYDHTELLGDTLDLIAREKAGIFKHRVPALTCTQTDEAMQALEQVARKVEAPLRVVPELASYQSDSAALLGLKGQFQHANAALAVALCQEWEQHHVATAAAPSDAARERVAGLQAGKLPPLYQAGLAACQFAGRAQTVSMGRDDVPGDVDTSADTEAAMSGQNDITFFMDGAHTPESMSACARWFGEASSQQGASGDVERVLVFNCQQDRNAETLLRPVAEALQKGRWGFDYALFVPAQSVYSSVVPEAAPRVDTAWQQQNCKIWGGNSPASGPHSAVHSSLQEALRRLKQRSYTGPRCRMHVLVTGSLHLVGDALRLLRKEPT